MKTESKKNYIFYAFVIIISFLLYRRDIGNSNINKFVFLFIVVAYALISDYKRLMMATSFLLPLANGLPGNYIFPFLCFLIYLKGNKRIHASSLVWTAFIIIVLAELLHIWLLANYFNLSVFLGYCSAIFLLFIVGGADCDGSDNSKNAFAFCVGSVVMLTIILMNFSLVTGNDIMEMNVRVGNTHDYIEGDELSLGTNPNNIGLYSIATIALSFVLWRYKKIPIWVMVLLCVLSFLAGVGSVSRTWFLCLILFGLLFFILNKGNTMSKGNSLISIFLILFGVAGVYLFFIRNGNVLDSFVDRFEGSQVETAGARTTIFVDYHNWMFKNPWALLIGTGAESYKEVTGIYDSTHNSLQQIFIVYGLPGFIFFLYLLFRSIKKWHVSKERLVYLPILVISFFLQSSQFLNPHYCMYPFIASFFILKMVKHDSLIDDAQKVKSKKTIM